MNVIKSGVVTIYHGFDVKSFDEDEGWITTHVTAGFYNYRILDVAGWRPQQLLIKGEWLDLGGACEEVNKLI